MHGLCYSSFHVVMQNKWSGSIDCFTIPFSIMSMVHAMHAVWYTLFSMKFHYPHQKMGNQNSVQLEMYLHFLPSVNKTVTILIRNA
jgi:hypothetical protein